LRFPLPELLITQPDGKVRIGVRRFLVYLDINSTSKVDHESLYLEMVSDFRLLSSSDTALSCARLPDEDGERSLARRRGEQRRLRTNCRG